MFFLVVFVDLCSSLLFLLFFVLAKATCELGDAFELVPETWYKPTSYCLFAGLVFIPMHGHADGDGRPDVPHAATAELLYAAAGEKHDTPGQQVVALATVRKKKGGEMCVPL